MNKIRVEISYPFGEDWKEAQKEIVKIAKVYGGNPNGDAGAGFGRRDMGFIFPDKDKVLDFAKEVDKKIIDFDYVFPDED